MPQPNIKRYFDQKISQFKDFSITKNIQMFNLPRQYILDRDHLIWNQIVEEDIVIPKTPKDLSSVKYPQIPQYKASSLKARYQMEFQSLKKKYAHNEHEYLQAKKALIMQRDAELQLQRQTDKAKKQQALAKIRVWNKSHSQIVQKQSQKQRIKLQMQMQAEERQRRQKQSQLAFKKLQKQKTIQKRLRELQEKKQERQRFFQAANTIQIAQPKYKILQELKQQKLQQQKFQQQINKKNRKMMMLLDHQAIKEHQKQYLRKLQDMKHRTQSQASFSKHKFTMFLEKDQEKTKQEIQKKKRRWEFQERLKDIPLEIDESKKIQIAIIKDKAKNPFKYNFLNQKSLNDLQIYGEFPTFSIPTDSKKIGTEYLKNDLPKINSFSRLVHSRSQSLITHKQLNSVTAKPKYTDYLTSMRQSRVEQPESMRGLSKQRILKKLQQDSNRLQKQALNQKNTLRYKVKPTLKNISRETINIDQNYAKAIKLKLQCLELATQ